MFNDKWIGDIERTEPKVVAHFSDVFVTIHNCAITHVENLALCRAHGATQVRERVLRIGITAQKPTVMHTIITSSREMFVPCGIELFSFTDRQIWTAWKIKEHFVAFYKSLRA